MTIDELMDLGRAAFDEAYKRNTRAGAVEIALRTALAKVMDDHNAEIDRLTKFNGLLASSLNQATEERDRLTAALERARNWIDTSMGKAKPSVVREIVAMLDAALAGEPNPLDAASRAADGLI